VATILSFFIPGIGQIYNGQIGKAVAFLVVWFFCACILFIPLIGWLIAGPALAVWIWSMIDAYSGAEAVNRELSLRQQYPDWRR
jgi:TM2 domain-containing membrane protein YozV